MLCKVVASEKMSVALEIAYRVVFVMKFTSEVYNEKVEVQWGHWSVFLPKWTHPMGFDYYEIHMYFDARVVLVMKFTMKS